MKTTKKAISESDALKATNKHLRVMTALAKRGLSEKKAKGKPSAKTLLELKEAQIEFGRLIRVLKRAS